MCKVTDAWARRSSEARRGGTLIIGRHLFILPLYNSVKELGLPPPSQTSTQRKTCPSLSMDKQSETSESAIVKSHLQFDFHSSQFKASKTGTGKMVHSVNQSYYLHIDVFYRARHVYERKQTVHMP